MQTTQSSFSKPGGITIRRAGRTSARHGEDALTWNVFRSLDPTRRPARPPEEADRDSTTVQRIFGLSGCVEEMLFWGCDPDGTSEAQQELSICLRALDGQLKGNMTEPDLVLITADDVCFVECKLRFTPLPWSAKAPKPPGDDSDAGADEAEQEPSTPNTQAGWEKRWANYLAQGTFAPHLQSPGPPDRDVYQLIRNAIYARLLADTLGKRNSVVLSLVSRLQWELFPDMERQYAHFRTRCSPFMTIAGPIFWEDVMQQVSPLLADRIRDALAVVASGVSDYITSTIRNLRSGVEEVCRRAQAGLRHFPLEHLREHFHDLVRCFAAPRAADIRGTVIARLTEAGSEAIPALVAGLEYNDPLVRIGCLEVLEKVGSKDRDRSVQAIDAFLRKRLRRTPQKEAARRALVAIDSQASGATRAGQS